MIREIKGITIHNTSNELTARQNLDLLRKLQAFDVMISVHYFVDDKEIIQATSENEITYHTGMGNDFGNLSTISIEICKNFDEEKYKKAEENAVDLIKNLMIKHDLTYNDVFFHQDFNPTTDCPRAIVYDYTKEEWLKKVGLMPKAKHLT